MRIPSQFNEDSLYRRKTGRGEGGESARRVVRLVIGLFLVLVVMKQAARPEIYEAFFGREAQVAITDATAEGKNSSGSTGNVVSAGVEEIQIEPADRELALRVTAEMLPTDRRSWLLTLARWQTGRSVSEVPSTVDSVRTELNDSGVQADGAKSGVAKQVPVWNEMLDEIERVVESGEGAEVPAPMHSPLAAWLATLDDWAASTVVDGSFWQSGDFEAFYRYLDQAPWISEQNVAATGVVPLLQQPKVYRNQRVRAAGRVARAEKLPANENVYGITDYWQLWLRPSDGADRPMLVIVPKVPDEIAAIGADATESDGPQVELVGRFLKRWAYRSSMGADLAPVVVGRLLPPRANPVATTTSSVEPAGTSQLFWVLSLTTLAGVAVAALAMWRTAVAGKRARQLRSKRKDPNEFLQGLAEQGGGDD